MQHHRRQVGAQDFRVGKRRSQVEIGLAVESDTDTGGDPAAAPLALVGAGLGHRLYRQPLHLGAKTVTTDTRHPGVDHIPDPGNRDRGLGDVGRQHHPYAPARGGVEHAILLGLAEAGIQRQHIQRGVVPQLPGEVPDIALPGQEYQHVAAAAKPAGIDVLDQCGYLRGDTLLGSGLPGVQVMRLHRIGATRHLDHWRIIEVAGKTVDIDGGRGDNQLEIGPLRQQAFEVTQQEVDIEAALVGLVDDDGVVTAQQAVALYFRQQDAIGHQLDRTGRRHLVGEAHLVADQVAKAGIEFLGDAPGHRARRQPPRLGVADDLFAAAPQCQADLGQLGRFARPGLTGYDHHLVRGDGARDVLPSLGDGQVFGEGNILDANLPGG